MIERVVAWVAAVGDQDDFVHREAGLYHLLDEEGVGSAVVDRSFVEMRIKELSRHLIHNNGEIDLWNAFVLLGVSVGGVLDGGGIARDGSAVEGTVSNLAELLRLPDVLRTLETLKPELIKFFLSALSVEF